MVKTGKVKRKKVDVFGWMSHKYIRIHVPNLLARFVFARIGRPLHPIGALGQWGEEASYIFTHSFVSIPPCASCTVRK